MEESFEKLKGVEEVISGYSGGITANPTYREVTYGDTGHFEVVEIIYDSEKISNTGRSQAAYRRALLDALQDHESPNLASVAVKQIKLKTDKWKADQRTKALAIGDWGGCKAGRCTTCANNRDGACG